ncbi:hypothetical protein Salat_1875100 [Sesamum alatum]|uniref:RNase H type-1 domain-containing protein n=1 Tax=Sesamum alatum TaxID=300844 RepID=A0AAE1Y3F5_9LAMI|nr:hypothetical protein Salat_1875100 [Sesamum alatum]
MEKKSVHAKTIGYQENCIFSPLGEILKAMKFKDANYFLVLYWALWNNRNTFLIEGKHTLASDLVNSAVLKLHEFVECSHCLDPTHSTPSPSPTWIPPNPRITKLNFDGAVFQSQSAKGASVIARNKAGELVVSLISVFLHWLKHTALEALKLATEGRWKHIVLKGDCRDVIRRSSLQ